MSQSEKQYEFTTCKHLPGIPSADEVKKNGRHAGETPAESRGTDAACD